MQLNAVNNYYYKQKESLLNVLLEITNNLEHSLRRSQIKTKECGKTCDVARTVEPFILPHFQKNKRYLFRHQLKG
jgi:hypothetical protein